MSSGRRDRTGTVRLACVLTLATSVLAAGSAGEAARVGPASPAGNGALTSLTLTSVGSDGKAAQAPSTQSALAAGGGYVAFTSQAALPVSASAPADGRFSPYGQPPVSRIYVHDLQAGETTLLSDPADGDATAPDISANGRLVSYEQGGDVYVADRQATGSGQFDTRSNLMVRRITGTENDLPYEHAAACPAGLGAGRITPCGPRLSADGSTLAYPAVLTPVSPALSVTATFGDDDTPAALDGDMLDFTPYDADSTLGQPGGTADVSYTNTGITPIAFGRPGASVTEPPGTAENPPFSLSGDTCAGRLGPGRSCTVEVSFQQDACLEDSLDRLWLASGDLVTHAAGPAGQSVLELTGFCDLYRISGPRQSAAVTTTAARPAADASAAHCPAPPTGLALAAAAPAASDDQGAPLSDAGAAELGRPYVAWTTVGVPEDQSTVSVFFQAANDAGCQIRLVDPAALRLADPLPAQAPPACHQGETLTGGTTGQECTAYLLIDPGAIAPDSALLGTTIFTTAGPIVWLTTYLTEHGVQHVIVARHDLSGAGNFATSPSTVVSVTSSGAELPDATQPSVSADGRYVGFAAPVPVGGTGQQVAAGASEVWRHDTDEAGNRSYRPGVTTMVSCLPRTGVGPCLAAANADSPSVSGDGQQVAFATSAAVAARNGYPGTGTDTAGASGDVSPDQVYLRSVAGASTTLISEPYGRKITGGKGRARAGGGNQPSYAPVITQDGTGVAYLSQATNLTATPVAAGAANVYLRPASAAAGSELASATGASLPAGTVVGVPGIDTHGRLVTFPATAALTAGAPAGIASVYTFDRLPLLSPAPATARFGRVLLDSGARSIAVTMTDRGPGPGTVTAVGVTGPFLVSGDGCTGVTLYHGSRCVVTVAFTPAAFGRAVGVLAVTTQDDGEPPVIASVPASAAVPVPRLATSPAVASSGDSTQVSATGFPPGQKVTLSWSLGLGSVVATVSGAGTFGAYLVIFPDDVTGPRTLIATGRHGVLASAPFLVQQAPVEPPFTSNQLPG
jgi:hypothetical protein